MNEWIDSKLEPPLDWVFWWGVEFFERVSRWTPYILCGLWALWALHFCWCISVRIGYQWTAATHYEAEWNRLCVDRDEIIYRSMEETCRRLALLKESGFVVSVIFDELYSRGWCVSSGCTDFFATATQYVVFQLFFWALGPVSVVLFLVWIVIKLSVLLKTMKDVRGSKSEKKKKKKKVTAVAKKQQ